jgi:hypothetical protein
MRTVKSFILCAIVAALIPAAAGAQERKIHFNVGGGPTFLGGDIGNVFSNGWGPAVGVTFDITPRVGFQFEYAYRAFSAENYVDTFGGTYSANHHTHQLDFNMTANLTKPGSAVRVFALAGPGAYQRNVNITEYVGTGYICDPWLYVCGYYPVTSVIGGRGGWDFGFNVGAGVGFKIGDSAEFTIEQRFHYVVGPDIEAPPNSVQPVGTTYKGGSSNGYYYPLTFGFRF